MGANRNFASSKMFSGHVMPVEIDCQFIVNSSNSAGLGITGLKGPYVQNVFMHTSATPGVGNSNPATPNRAITNPNPASGTIVLQLQDSFTQMYGMDFVCESPLGTPVSSTTLGVAYVITALGTASAAQWLAAGVPAGVTPAIGVAFIAAQTASIGGSATAAPSAAAGSAIFAIEVLGQPALNLAAAPAQSGIGSQIILQCRKDTSDASAIAAPANGSVIHLKLLLSNSSVQVGGY